MAKRIARKSTVPAVAVVTVFSRLPGAVFFDDPVAAADLDFAASLQRIRSAYENDDCQEMLWHECQQLGFDSSEISRFVANPAAITNCGYGVPIPLR